ncbi:MAG TPA: imidazolonepropionase [Clostridiaceae bacterium]|nr:imidazolonepropionase [Clostridiaceae bacterium]
MDFLVIENAAELVTPIGRSALFGRDMAKLHVIKDGAVLCRHDEILAVGTTSDIEKTLIEHMCDPWSIIRSQGQFEKTPTDYKYEDITVERIDASGKTVLPGYVDPHTHFIFGGYRQDEFQMRLQGATYMEIMEAGGGIASTNKATREATVEQLYEAGFRRLDRMLDLGITTVEGKTGYGEDTETEDKMLTVMERLDRDHPVDIVRTYMGAHSVPPAYKGRTGDYVDYLIAEGLPMAKGRADFCDVFTEKGVFELDDSERLLVAAREYGFKLKMHADEIVPLGGAGLAAKLRATSADHLLKASDEDLLAMRDAGVVATLLPCTAFSLREPYARGRFMIDNGLAVALGTDLNPGSCYTQSIPLMTALATIYMEMTIEETITALTLNAAAAIDRAETVGSLEPGKKADIIVLDCPDHRHLSYHFAMNLVETVVKNGVMVRKPTN